MTELSGSGRSTTAEALAARLSERGRAVTLLDGEVVRHGGVAICPAINPFRSTRNRCLEMVGADRFLEVFRDTPLETAKCGQETSLQRLAPAS